MSKIMKEIAKATSSGSMDKGEDIQAYRHRLLTDSSNLEDDAWGKLSPEAQQWLNDAQKAENDGQDIPPFPDDAEGQEEETTEDKTPAVEEPKPTAPKKKKPANASTTKKESAPVKKKTASKKNGAASTKKAASSGKKTAQASQSTPTKKKLPPVRGPGAQNFLKLEILKNPNITGEELQEKLRKKGFKMSSYSVNSIRSSFRNSLKMIRDAGHLKGIDI